MSTKASDSCTIQKNGYIVMDALHALDGPVTLQKLVKQIAETHNLKADRIKEPIKTVLQTGLDNGFIQRHNGKYSICGVNINFDEEDDNNCTCNEVDEYAESTENEELDKCGCSRKRKRKRSCSRPRPSCRRKKSRKRRC